MSAATEELLKQILNLEIQLQEAQHSGKDYQFIEEQLFLLREKFNMMNESLSNNKNVLKG